MVLELDRAWQYHSNLSFQQHKLLSRWFLVRADDTEIQSLAEETRAGRCVLYRERCPPARVSSKKANNHQQAPISHTMLSTGTVLARFNFNYLNVFKFSLLIMSRYKPKHWQLFLVKTLVFLGMIALALAKPWYQGSKYGKRNKKIFKIFFAW